MKLIFTVLILFTHTVCHSQVTILSPDLPDAGDVLITRGATLLSTVDLESTGPGYTWNFGFDILQPGNVTNETTCLDVGDSPFIYQVLFNNPFDPLHNSDFAYGIDEFGGGGLTFEDAYFYFQNSNTKYVQTGAGVTINSIPIGAQGNPVDVIYHLPIEYLDEDEGSSKLLFEIPTLGAYELRQNRHNYCSGYGTLNIWNQTFPVLMMRTEIAATDSVYIDLLGYGLALDRPLSVEYKWISPDFKVPVLQITTTGGLVTSVQTADIYTGINEENTETAFEVFPNPVMDILTVQGLADGDAYNIMSAGGKVCKSGLFQGNGQLDVTGLSPGQYFLSVHSTGGVKSAAFVKL